MTEVFIFHVCLEIPLTFVSLGDGFGVGSPKLASQVHIDKPIELFFIRMGKKVRSTACNLKGDIY
jgi:hypothetical protein